VVHIQTNGDLNLAGTGKSAVQRLKLAKSGMACDDDEEDEGIREEVEPTDFPCPAPGARVHFSR
jgi:hypothetical protein